MKNDRQRRIKELLETENLRTQSEISQRLIEEGYNATQATVSRDLKSLCLNKSGGKRAGSYSIRKSGAKSTAASRYDDMKQYIVSVKSAMNIVVIKTVPGFAQAIASSVDNRNHPSILGCVAGDDTIIIVATDTITASDMVYDTGFFAVEEETVEQEADQQTEEAKEDEK